MSAMLPVMLGYLIWLGWLWISFLGGVSLAIAIFGVAAVGAVILLVAFAYSPQRGRAARRLKPKAPERALRGKVSPSGVPLASLGVVSRRPATRRR